MSCENNENNSLIAIFTPLQKHLYAACAGRSALVVFCIYSYKHGNPLIPAERAVTSCSWS